MIAFRVNGNRQNVRAWRFAVAANNGAETPAFGRRLPLLLILSEEFAISTMIHDNTPFIRNSLRFRSVALKSSHEASSIAGSVSQSSDAAGPPT